VEEQIIERAKRKMVLEHLVIKSMDTSGNTVLRTHNSADRFSADDLQGILKFGAEELFKKSDEEEKPSEDLDIDEILARAEAHETKDESAHEELLNSFKVADFGTSTEANANWTK